MIASLFQRCGGLACAVVVIGTSGNLYAAPPQQASIKLVAFQDEKPADEKPAAAEAAEEKKDPYALPTEGGVKELLEFIKSVRSLRPETPQLIAQHRQKMLAAIKSAAEKIKATATDEEKKLPGYDEAMSLLLQLRSMQAREMSPEEFKQFVGEIKSAYEQATTPAAKMGAVQTAMSVATGLEYGGKPAEAIATYREFGELFAKSDDSAVSSAAARMEGAARRLDLIGNQLELTGTLMDGAKFDWAKYRGKVVLVDFWATWCGPCIAELPNVKKNYELYHDKGFDVVGVSLDDDRARLEEFIKKEGNPWVNLHDGGWNDNKVATHYGIMGIPTVILVDKEGKVVSTRARGPELGRLLAELLGPAEPAVVGKAEGAAKDEEK